MAVGRIGELDVRASLAAVLSPSGCEVGDWADTVARALVRLFGLDLSASLKVAFNALSEDTSGIVR
eukprot:568303-Amphidinium_carterae.1